MTEIPAIDDLRAALAPIAKRARRHQRQGIGEQNTKSTLISPVLRALGWDDANLDEVRLEYRPKAGDKPVDYALLLQREPQLFLEAKALDENLEDRRWSSQIISYAAVAGVEWVVLTNGDEYRIYNAHAPVPVESKLFRSVRLTEDIDKAAESLALLSKAELRRNSLAELWRSYSIDTRVKEAVSALFQPEPSRWLVRHLTRQLPGLSQGEIKAALNRARISLDFPGYEPSTGLPQVDTPGLVKSRRVKPEKRDGRKDAEQQGVSLRDLINAGLVTQGLALRKKYLGHEVSAHICADGSVQLGDHSYDSLSTAAGMARVEVKGPPPDGRRFYQTNGWTFWEFEDESGQRRPIDHLRKLYLRREDASRSG